MVKIAIATDNINGKSSDTKTLNSVVDLLKSKGHTVTSYGVGPNKVQRSMLSKSNSCDLMIQIAGGKCLGTLVDFYQGIKNGYYHAKAGGFMYFKCWNANWKAKRAHDDHFSKQSALAPYVGKTLPEIYPMLKPYCFYGYGTTAQEITTTFLNNYNGSGDNTSTSTTSEGRGGGNNVLELIKQVLTPYLDYGVELLLEGDTVRVRRTNPNTASILNEKDIVNNSISFEEYDPNTPNVVTGSNGVTVRDERLISMYGQVSTKVESSWPEQIAQILKRDHGHSIDLKTLVNPDYCVGKWVKLQIPSLGVDDYYYVTKNSLEEERIMSLTLEPAPPAFYVEEKEDVGDGDTSSSSGANIGRICKIIEQVGGVKITDFRSLYENFKKMHYKLYMSERYDLETELSRIQKGLTMNCTDFGQLYYEAYKEAGFKDEIQIVRGVVKCSTTSYGHIWCRVKQNGNWLNVDPSAAAAHNYNIGTLICTRGASITNINPSWLLSDDGKT